ncbi:hypothetical protein [Streptomyces spinosisporus]|uniref:Lipoprotein n=1 Tax=Streptomyces spinosisporus TaxID=2927582 RepID=A0ABS9XKX8_9ACTN|nr:hypothetical protein [Streptomyces spinosisporus]MCI3242720.1 hypothetical protein [Streptomyces spinosisporus]
MRFALPALAAALLMSCAPPAAKMPDAAGPSGSPSLAHRTLRVYLTGYAYHDNSPARSSTICCPVLHKSAGGNGTYDDPITAAVPGSGATMEWPPGTRFYLPGIRRYVIVEDSGASRTPAGVEGHLDVWVGGKGAPADEVEAEMERITGDVTAELSPPRGRPVIEGPLFAP